MEQTPIDHDILPSNTSIIKLEEITEPMDCDTITLDTNNKNNTLMKNSNIDNNKSSNKDMSNSTYITTEAENNTNLSKTNNLDLPILAPKPLPFDTTENNTDNDKPFDLNSLSLPIMSSLSELDFNQIEVFTQIALATLTANSTDQEENETNKITAEMIKREILNQKVRADNRERKKRWREQNEERNKDNDLRCRVNKRANKLFGKEKNETKQIWIESEFTKRQYKRKEKERRKNAVDNVVSENDPNSMSDPNDTYNTSSSLSSPSSKSFISHLPILQDAYLSMVLNNLETMSPASALKFVEGMRLMESTIKNADSGNEQSLSHQVAEFLQRLQQYQPTEQEINERLRKSELQLSSESTPMDHDDDNHTSLDEPTPSYVSSSAVSSPSLSTTEFSSPSSSLSPSPSTMNSLTENININTNTNTSNNTNLNNDCDLHLSSSSNNNNNNNNNIHDNKSLSTLLISTLQQTAVIDSNIKQEDLFASLTSDDFNNNKDTIPRHPNQLYPMEHIMILSRLNTQWKNM